MTRMLTLMTLATIFTSTAMAQAQPDFDAPVCDSAEFKNQGQWIQCLQDNGVRGKDLARAIHDEHQARKGGETTERSKRGSKRKARKAHRKHREGEMANKGARPDVKPDSCSQRR